MSHIFLRSKRNVKGEKNCGVEKHRWVLGLSVRQLRPAGRVWPEGGG